MENVQSIVVGKQKRIIVHKKDYQQSGVVFLMDSFFSILVCEGFVSFTFDWVYTEKLTFSLNYFDLHTITYQWISYN